MPIRANAASLRIDDRLGHPTGASTTKFSPELPSVRLRLAQSMNGTEVIAPPAGPRDRVSSAGAPAAAPRAPYQEMFLEVDVNEQHIDRTMLVLRRPDGMFLVPVGELASFRLKIPSTAPYSVEGAPYFAIDTLAGGRFAFDERRQRLMISVDPDAFEPSAESASTVAPYPVPTRSSTGGFLNYQLDAGYAPGNSFFGAALEAGFFTPWGVLLNTVVANGNATDSTVARLDTTFSADFPSSHATLRVGDSVFRPGAWGSATRFGGVQYGTNFATEPGFIAYPTQAVRGQAVVPSVVDIYLNNALVMTRRVDPGPFSFNNIPFTTGGGSVRLVVRDINNREQAITVSEPFYASNIMLKPGLADYSAEIGKVRENYGIDDWSYGQAFASGLYRRGFSESFTGEVRAEGSSQTQAAGLSGSLLQRKLGQVDITAAGSHSIGGSGWLAGLGYQRQTLNFSIGGQAQWTSAEFRRIGLSLDQPLPRLQAAGSVGVQLDRLGSLTASYVTQRQRILPDTSVASLGYSVGLGPWGQLNVTTLKAFGEQSGVSVSVGLTVPLSPGTTFSAQTDDVRTDTGRTRDLSMALQHNRIGDSPWSYRLNSHGREIESMVNYRADRAELQADIARLTDGTVVSRGQVSGGIGYVGGYAFLSRRITGSFGVVKVADYPDVAVLFENQFIGRTNERGFFVVPDLRAYDRNNIGIRASDIPLDASVMRLKLEASPYYRSGILIEFPVQRSRSATLSFVLDDGTPLPPGALAHLEGSAEEFPAAMGGEIYLSGFAEHDRIVVTWKGQTCRLEVTFPQTTDPLPDLGKHLCKGVKP